MIKCRDLEKIYDAETRAEENTLENAKDAAKKE
jgi:hypothetical protein